MLRVFFAALPSPKVAQALGAAAQDLSLTGAARAVTAGRLHLTVAFVGAVAESRLAELVALGRGRRFTPFALRFDAYEYWPKPEVIVAAARLVPPELAASWQQLHRDLADHGWALEPKRLRPHVTLARKVAQAPVLPALTPIDWSVGDLSLMCSDTSGAESVYTVVDTWPLLYGTEKH